MKSAGKIKRLLVANRGEIAFRILRSCKDLGIETAIVFSEPDRAAPYIGLADFAAPLSGSSPLETYLDATKLLTIAKHLKVDAVHPGYGFLAENRDFAEACARQNLHFVGPQPEVLGSMGNKIEARALAERCGLPVIPGTTAIADDKKIISAAKRIGFPLLVKCSAGGGGHGMRAVHTAKQLPEALRAARSEGGKAFGDDTVYLERLLENPRHIEVQLFGFSGGPVVHLHTRCCSVQRRHQKIIEEAPAPGLTQQQITAMESDAVKLGQQLKYTGPGTIEFLVDATGCHYFLEMNTRLQVEHAVTEMVVGIDLVAAQLLDAAGRSNNWLKILHQGEIPDVKGHAIECRLYAEDPLTHFSPSPGQIEALRLPQGPWVRVDAALYEGLEVSPYYDPMIAKIVCWGTDRQEARLRMLRALDETFVAGVETNLALLKETLQLKSFIAGGYSTAILDEENVVQTLQKGQNSLAVSEQLTIAATLAWKERQEQTISHGVPLSSWQRQYRKEEPL